MNSGAPPGDVPKGLLPEHMLLAVDHDVHVPSLEGVYDPRLATLTADGTLILARRDVDSTFGTSATRLGPDRVASAWRAIIDAGVAVDAVLELPGYAQRTVTTTSTRFRVDDGRHRTDLVIHDLGSELAFSGDPPISASEMRLRASATDLLESLRRLGDDGRWVPPALLFWWRVERPGDWNATVVRWPLALDLATAGRRLDHPVWERCIRLDGGEAASVADVARGIPIDHLVEHDDVRYVLNVRAIHADDDVVACP